MDSIETRAASRQVSGRHGFARDEQGSFIIFGLMLFFLMLLMGGLAVDLMRFETHRARLQSTLDRAVLAAASLSQPLEPTDVVVDYFNRAGLENYIDPINVISDANLTSREVSATATMQVPTSFLSLMGFHNLYAPSAGTAIESASRTEISLVVDTSGSMSWSSSSGHSKIYELRQAATEFVNILQCNPEDPDDTVNCTVEPDTVSITLIPYDEQVVAGEAVLDQLNVTNEHEITSCVTFALDDFNSASIDPTAPLKRTGHFDPWRGTWDNPGSWTCKTAAYEQILPFENEPADLRDQIADLEGGGYTSIDVGMKWAGAFLDPAFQPVVQGLVAGGQVDAAFDDRPYDYTEPGIQKVVVIMTDGVNTTQHYLYEDYRDGPSGVYVNTEEPGKFSIYNPSSGQYYWTHEDDWFDHPYGAGVSGGGGGHWQCWGWWYCWWVSDEPAEEPGEALELTFPELWQIKTWDWYSHWWWLDNPGSSFGQGTKDSRLDTICGAVKSQNVTVFAIGFETTGHSSSVMESCASSSAHFFDVEGSDLTDAFAAIARQISQLRLIN